MTSVQDDFWDKWIAANDFEKVDLIATLPVVASNTVPPFLKHSTAAFINSYLDDLRSYMIRKEIKHDIQQKKG